MAASNCSKNGKIKTSRIETVFIRKSTQGQDESGQIANIGTQEPTCSLTPPGTSWTTWSVPSTSCKTNSGTDGDTSIRCDSEK
jgi:hypothetical protein